MSRSRSRRRFLWATSLVALAALAGCGDDDGVDDEEGLQEDGDDGVADDPPDGDDVPGDDLPADDEETPGDDAAATGDQATASDDEDVSEATDPTREDETDRPANDTEGVTAGEDGRGLLARHPTAATSGWSRKRA